VNPEIRKLYQMLEVQFHPLMICQNVAPILSMLSENEKYAKYVNPLHQIILTRLLQQVRQVLL
jgi:translation initiation factor 3 subunit A